MIAELREVIRRRGVRGGARRVYDRLSPTTRWHDEFIWYELDVQDPQRPRRVLDPEFALRRGEPADAALLAQLPTDLQVTSMTPEVVEARLAAGAWLWVVVDGDRLAFSCWNFLGAGPLTGAGADRPIPPGVVMLEDSIASPHVRGRGVAPGAWTGVADAHAADGRTAMVTKVAADNVAVQKALEKAGFVRVAHMHRSGPIWRTRITITGTDGAPTDHWLASLSH
jgi:RimJ/RimL family protein N-acetyltransferase